MDRFKHSEPWNYVHPGIWFIFPVQAETADFVYRFDYLPTPGRQVRLGGIFLDAEKRSPAIHTK